MKLNENFLIHQTDNGEILIPVGEETKRFHGVIKLNETGSLIVHLLENDKIIDQILTLLDKNKEEDKQRLFFDGQIYDAFSFMVSIVKKANKDIILIDNYVNVETLDILAKKKKQVNVHIITSKNTKLTQYDIDKFNSQYPTLTLNFTDKFHDRFFIIDHSTAYHIGASIKDA